MMKIDHFAIWTDDLERLRDFYMTYFSATSGEKYFNPVKQFESYFLSFGDGPRLEIMRAPGIIAHENKGKSSGLTHFAISVGSKLNVDALTEHLRSDGYHVAGEPRTTGDGYYESVVIDPDGNSIEITI